MKKNIFTAALLAACMISAVPAQGMSGQVTETVRSARERAMAQFNQSLNRVQRCFRGQCTKMEALKAARDLGIAAAAAITAIYITGAALKKGAPMAPSGTPGPTFRAPRRPARVTTTPAAPTVPAPVVTAPPGYLEEPSVPFVFSPETSLQLGDKVKVGSEDILWTVTGFEGGRVRVQHPRGFEFVYPETLLKKVEE